MEIALFWLSSLVSAFLIVATVMALTCKIRRFYLRIILPAILALLLFIAGLGATLFLCKWSAPESHWLMFCALSWIIVYLLGSVFLLRSGMRMQEQEISACRRSAGKLAISFIAVMSLCLCVLLIMDNTVKIKLAAMRSEAISVAISLQPPGVQDHLNACFLYENAFEKMETKDWPYWMQETGEPAFDLSRKGIKEILEGEREAIELLQRAAGMPGYYYEIDYLKNDVPGLISYKNAANLLVLNSRAKAFNREIPAAFENIAAIRKMADHLKTIPSITANMMGAAIQNIGTRSAEYIISLGQPFSIEDTGIPLEEKINLQKAFHRALRMDEAYMAFTATSYLTTNSLDLLPPAAEILYRSILLYDELVTARNILFEAHAIALKPYREAVDEWERWENKAKAFHGPITAVSIPYYGRRMEIRVLEAEAGRRLTNLAFAAYAYQREHKTYPAHIEALAPEYINEIPVDPFSGKQLKLVSTEGGIILYSVGPDLKDDGGAVDYDISLKGKGINAGDSTFILGQQFEDRRMKPSYEMLKKREEERMLRPGK